MDVPDQTYLTCWSQKPCRAGKLPALSFNDVVINSLPTCFEG